MHHVHRHHGLHPGPSFPSSSPPSSNQSRSLHRRDNHHSPFNTAAMEGMFYNVKFGYLEGIVRGYRNTLLTSQQYNNLTQCETIDGMLRTLQSIERRNTNKAMNRCQAATRPSVRRLPCCASTKPIHLCPRRQDNRQARI